MTLVKMSKCVKSAEGASENFRVFRTETAHDVIIFKFQGGGGNCPMRVQYAGTATTVGQFHDIRRMNESSFMNTPLNYQLSHSGVFVWN